MLVKQFLFQIECQNTLGENVLWHTSEQVLYWTDIQEKELYMWNAESGRTSSISLPFRMTSFAFTANIGVLLAAFEQGIGLYNIQNGELNWLSSPESNNEHTRFNDGKCDTQGRYWVGSMVENGNYNKLDESEKAALYCLKCEGANKYKSKRVLSGLHISNGLAFNKDSSIMYHADSPKHKIYAYSLDRNGEIVNKKLFAKFEKNSFPDGACVDINENLWTAIWGGAHLACISNDGKKLFSYPLPITQPTCVCIGGPNMDWLFVTSAKDGLSAQQLVRQPKAGNLFVYQLVESLGRVEPITQVM
ncbi:SMP-30/gluconolactonase/LRE family protein [Glaciecola petra]|uniref:SMP-30/gluconolactonase/LRE family protein n=1 Tax=Glaciecola petra TaxID=3075602 RepID=A0ABU2ZTU5_9ALTE|nr:SMP-30/gluconolactonase/LRE family protein [Aestuariibacter sp. P117]MDT0596068.1 SMP-30/gluconolactonase/LRE family protein [Aestuariibacter sp. P117]